MPIPAALAPVVAAGIAAAAGLVGTGVGAAVNSRNRKFALEMYEKQRQDNEEDFHRQNAYNHPAQQMERLRQAGLNPNLVYGKGADTTAAVIKGAQKPDFKAENWAAPLANVATNALTVYQNVQTQQAQRDNIIASTKAINQDVVLKQAQTAQIAAATAKTEQETRLASDLYQNTVQSANVALEQAKANLGTTGIQQELMEVQKQQANQNLIITSEAHNKAMEEADARINKMYVDNKLTLEQAAIAAIQRRVDEKYKEARTQAEIENIKRQGELLVEQIRDMNARGQLNQMELEAEKVLGKTGSTVRLILDLIMGAGRFMR